MKINLVNIENGLHSKRFRKLAHYTAHINAEKSI